MEYLVIMTTRVPDGTSEEAIDDIRTREAARSRELASQGHLLRLWRPPLQPGEWRSLGLFAAADGDELERVLASMPLRVWRTDEVTPLSRHPNDPALAGQSGSHGIPDHLHPDHSGGHARPDGAGHQGARGRTRARAGRPGTPAPAVDAAGRGALAGPLASPGRGRDAGDPEIAPAGCLDDRADQAAHPAPQRPGDSQDLTDAMTGAGQRVASITGQSRATGSPACPVSHPGARRSHHRWRA